MQFNRKARKAMTMSNGKSKESNLARMLWYRGFTTMRYEQRMFDKRIASSLNRGTA